MADGTLRLIVDIEPRDAVAAFGLFGQPGTALALAAIKPGAQPEPEPEKPKGGYAAKWLALRCQEPAFRSFLIEVNPFGWRTSPSESVAAQQVRFWCLVDSRADIDHNPKAKAIFDQQIRLPYQKWCATHGFTAPEVVEA